MAHRTLLALVLTGTLLSTGCGTIGNLKRPYAAPADNPNAPVCKIYGGLRNDFFTMLDYPWSQTTFWLDYVTIPLLAIIDLTLDTFGDTFTLPISAVKATRRAIEGPVAPASYTPVATPQPATIIVPPGATPLPTPRPVETLNSTSPR